MPTHLISSFASPLIPAAVALLLAVPAQVRPDDRATEGAARPGPRGPAPRSAQEAPGAFALAGMTSWICNDGHGQPKRGI